jgi:hypothetical protein
MSGQMTTLVEDEELQRLRAMAEGRCGFQVSRRLERLAAKDWGAFKKLSARERLAVGYYQAAKSRSGRVRESGVDQP